MNKSEIYYDANFAVNEYRGMGKYINNFVSVLKNKGSAKPIGLLRNNLTNAGFYKSFGFANYILWEQISLLLFAKNSSGMMIFPYNTAPIFLNKSKNHVLILHDLIYMNDFKATSVKQKIGALYRKFVVPRIIGKFEKIITVSEYSKTQIVETFNLPPARVTVIYNSIDLENYDREINLQLDKREKYILHIGGEPYYKNSKSVIYAFAMLPAEVRTNYKLKIVGIRNKHNRAEYLSLIEEHDIMDKVVLMEYQTDDEIIQLYQNASLFVFPSFSEGFGIPIIESFKYGCPLICSNTTCFPEIAGSGAIYFDPSNIKSIANAMMNVFSSSEIASQIVSNGYEQLEKFSKRKFTRNVLSWYEDNF